MTYVRHRDRMVQESVQEDLVNTLIACRWMSGTTTRLVINPYGTDSTPQVVTTAPTQVMKLVKGKPITLIDYFPEATSDEAALVGRPETGQAKPNTLAMDDGQPGEPQPLELGSARAEMPYRFTFAFYASSTGVAQALMNDLRDRYRGQIVNSDMVVLYDYNVDPDTPVCAMAVESFSYVRSADDESATPVEAAMFYAQLTVVDEVPDTHLIGVGPIGGLITGDGEPVTPAYDGVEYLDLESGDVYEWED